MRMEKVFFQFKLTARVPTLPTNHWNKVYKHLLFSIAPISGFCLFGWQKPCVLQFGHSTNVRVMQISPEINTGGIREEDNECDEGKLGRQKKFNQEKRVESRRSQGTKKTRQ